MSFYCYRLKYPVGFIADDGTDLSNVVFYVGKGQGDRMCHHEAEARLETLKEGANVQKVATIRSIWAKGMEVQKEVFGKTDSESDAFACEAEDIQENVSPYLTNRYHPSPYAIRGLAERVARREWQYGDPITRDCHPVFILTQEHLDYMLFHDIVNE
jgi:hypothetical protein